MASFHRFVFAKSFIACALFHVAAYAEKVQKDERYEYQGRHRGNYPWAYPFPENGLWGFINENGDWLLKPQYQSCDGATRNEFLAVKINDHWRLIDRSGSFLGKDGFDSISGKYEPILAKRGNKHILVTARNNITTVECDEIGKFSEGYGWARQGKYIGLLAENGLWEVKPLIEWGAENKLPEPLIQGVSWYEGDYEVWGVINKQGHVVLKPIVRSRYHHARKGDYVEGYERDATPWSDNGTAWASLSNHERALISTSGKILAQKKTEELEKDSLKKEPQKEFVGKDGVHYKRLTSYEHGCALFSVYPIKGSGSTFGLDVDAHELFCIPNSIYGRAEDWSEGLAAVEVSIDPKGDARNIGNITLHFINSTGQVVVKTNRNTIGTTGFHRGVAWVEEIDPNPNNYPNYGHWGLIDKTGREILPYIYSEPVGSIFNHHSLLELTEEDLFRGNFIIIHQGSSVGLATMDGRIILNPEFRYFGERFVNGLLTVAKGTSSYKHQLKGLIDENGNWVVKPKYDEIAMCSNGASWCREYLKGKGTYWGLIDKAGNVILPFEYAVPSSIDNYYDDGMRGLFKEKPLWLIQKIDPQDYNKRIGWGWVNGQGQIIKWVNEQGKIIGRWNNEWLDE